MDTAKGPPCCCCCAREFDPETGGLDGELCRDCVEECGEECVQTAHGMVRPA